MKRSDLRWSQLKVGMLLFLGFLLLVWVAFNSDFLKAFRPDTELTARFRSAEGLVAGNPVFFLGMEAGRVGSVEFDPSVATRPIRMRFEVREEVRRALRADAFVRVASLGVLGEKYLELVRGEAPAPLAEDAVLRAQTQTAFTDLIAPSSRALSRVDSLLMNLEDISGGIRGGEGSVGKLLANDDLHDRFVETLEETRATLSDLRRTQSVVGSSVASMSQAIASTAGTFDSLAAGWRRGDGTLDRLAEDPSLYENLNATAIRLDRVLAQIEQGDGLLARLLDDPRFADQATGLLVDLRALLRDMRENPGRYVQFSVF